MELTYSLAGFSLISDPFFDDYDDATLSVTLSTSEQTFRYSTQAFPGVGFSSPVPQIHLSIADHMMIDGTPLETRHPGLDVVTSLAQFTWSSGTTRMLVVDYNDFEGFEAETSYSYLFFIDGPKPPITSGDQFERFIFEEFDVINRYGLDENTTDAEFEAMFRDIFSPGSGTFAANRDIPLGAIDWDTVTAAPDTDDRHLIGTGQDDELLGAGGDDTLIGAEGDDSLVGAGGADTLHGGQGADTLFGAEGNDVLRGGPGADYLDGDVGDDVLRGQRHGDTIWGGAGEDNIKGGGGNDWLLGEGGSDYLKGGTRHDTLTGHDGHDRLIGNSGNDQLMGGEGNDILNAGGGDDVLVGGQGDDRLKGGEGADFFIFEDFMAVDTILDYEPGVDRLQLNANLLFGYSTAQEVVERLGEELPDGTPTLDFGFGDVIVFSGLTTLDVLLDDIIIV